MHVGLEQLKEVLQPEPRGKKERENFQELTKEGKEKYRGYMNELYLAAFADLDKHNRSDHGQLMQATRPPAASMGIHLELVPPIHAYRHVVHHQGCMLQGAHHPNQVGPIPARREIGSVTLKQSLSSTCTNKPSPLGWQGAGTSTAGPEKLGDLLRPGHRPIVQGRTEPLITHQIRDLLESRPSTGNIGNKFKKGFPSPCSWPR